MAIIAHVSDTHLGCTTRDCRAKLVNYNDLKMASLEVDFAKAFDTVVNKVLEKRENGELDCVVHSGDLFHVPFMTNPTPPSEPSRIVATRGFKKLSEAGIPVVIIDGNHGIFQDRRSSLVTALSDAIPNIHAATFWGDMVDILRGNKDRITFDVGGCTIHCFPYVSLQKLATIGLDFKEEYSRWLRMYKTRVGRISGAPNIVVAHGMRLDETLPSEILQMEADYIALGHDHVPKQLPGFAKSARYAGSTEKWMFDQFGLEPEQTRRSFSIVTVNENQSPDVEEVFIQTRPMIVEQVEIDVGISVDRVVDSIHSIFETHELDQQYNEETAARVKIFFTGAGYDRIWVDLAQEMVKISNIALRSNDMNIVQFRYEREIEVEEGPQDLARAPSVETTFLIDDPKRDFESFLNRIDVENLEKEKLASLFTEALERSEED